MKQDICTRRQKAALGCCITAAPIFYQRKRHNSTVNRCFIEHISQTQLFHYLNRKINLVWGLEMGKVLKITKPKGCP